MMKRVVRNISISFIFIISLYPGFLPAKDFEISAQAVKKNSIRIDLDYPADIHVLSVRKDLEIILFRSVAPLTGPNIDRVRYPIVEFHIDAAQNPAKFFDRHVAHNVTYHYLAFIRKKTGDEIVATSNPIEISTPNISIDDLTDPVILIDKTHYYLEIQNEGETAKRFPISLGRDPFKRKLHQDNKTTPEGLYKIINLQKSATFYKAIDIDYPNALDRIRYEFMKKEGQIPENRGIGGEIQIHGKHPRFGSIQRNWTWGCVSLRNADMDEIFRLASIKVGIPVIIIGQEFTLEDIKAYVEEPRVEEIKSVQKKLAEMGLYQGKIDGSLGKQTRFAIGRFQKSHDIPVSCVLDARTINSILD